MKKQKKIISLLMCLMILFTSTCNLIYALNENVLPGYNQVTTTGGTNSINREGKEDGVIVSKTISETNINNKPNLENYFDITLTVRTKTKVEEIITDQDLAIVVVMDISNTMVTYKMDGYKKDFDPDNLEGTRLEAAKEAAEQFIDDFAEYSTGVSAERKLGFVVFNKDAHDVFDLGECTTENKKSLKDEVTTKTNNIIKAIDENGQNYNGSYKRFTNIEAGLKRADQMLDATDIKNKYIIFISDGYPTTYVKSGVTGYNPYMNKTYNSEYNYSTAPTTSGSGKFYNELEKKLCTNGTSYSDNGAIKAAEMAAAIKSAENGNVKIYTIGIGIDKQTTVSNLQAYLVDVDKQTYEKNKGYALGSDYASFQKWLKESIGSDYLVEPKSKEELKEAYKNIFDKVKSYIESSSQATWVAEDPMNANPDIKNIEFIGFYDDNNVLQDSLDKKNNVSNQSDTASFSNDKITWDLKFSDYTETKEGDTTYYDYSVKYRVRLENENSTFSENTIYNTNGITTLTYVLRNTDGYLSENKYIDFPIPKIVGYLGNLTFTKKSSFDDTNLSGVKFELTHDTNCKCHQEKKYANIEKFAATSNEQGTVTFTNIPSGHTYKLTEIETQTDYILSDTIYDITVSYGETSGIPKTNIITNDIKKSNLEIQKIVEGNIDNPGKFKFNLEIYFKENKLSGNYSYKINNGETKTINIGTDIIELGNNDSMIIYDLPVGATYKITETTTEGYQVQYELNSKATENGSIVTCNQNNGCRLEEGSVNKVKFINLGGYLLPETGSSGMLILLIIGSLLLIGPVIYIGYEFYKNKKKIA